MCREFSVILLQNPIAMTVKELIEKLSAFDGDMNVLFTTFEPMPVGWATIAHPIDEIETKDSVDYAVWETKKVPPFVEISLRDGEELNYNSLDRVTK